jgi:para-aminobenzoate synthetase / 4-amino-4-deoxychorismate lyase
LDVIECRAPEEIPRAFATIERWLAKGSYAAGFLSYEAGYVFEETSGAPAADDFPFLCFGRYRPPRSVFRADAEALGPLPEAEWRHNISRRDYDRAIHRIRRHIAAGDVYQITYCVKVLSAWDPPAFSLYRELYRRQPVPYPAYIETDRFRIASLSPELFLKKTGSRIESRPMKGTWRRGATPLADRWARRRFEWDAKNRAENLMIADLLRNDLGRVGRGIEAPVLFEITPYTTLFQMTSTVTAEVKEDIGLDALFRAVFPSGSVTGAPRIRAMQVIRDIETEPRRIYTGAIGFIAPNKDLIFNIPIRTLLMEDGRAQMGIGGGIVWDSTPQGEWDEGVLKAKFLNGEGR